MRRNIQRRLDQMFPRTTGATQQFQQLSKLSGVGEETIRKMMRGESSPQLANIIAIAKQISLTLPELFTDAIATYKDVPRATDNGAAGMLQRRSNR